MAATILTLSVTSAGLALAQGDAPAGALASVTMTTNYCFDENVIAKVSVIDDKTASSEVDPLNNLVFKIVFEDKIDGSRITSLQGRLYTAGGIGALEQNYPNDFGYITGKLDFTGALDGANDFFEDVETAYQATKTSEIKTALANAEALIDIGSYRKKEVSLSVPASAVVGLDPKQVKRSILDIPEQPRYIVCAGVGNLPVIEAMAEVMDKLNCHLLVDVGNLTDWQMVVAVAESININDHRMWLFWNPNKSRPPNATSIMARKKWRPCVGDYLGQLLLRNANTDSAGIPPLNRPIAGYAFPVAFRDMERLEGVDLDEEAQNALAKARVNVVLNERFDAGSRWIYGDALTQHDSKTSALRLINSSEITTFVDNLVVGIVKKHLLKGMSSFINDATTEATRTLNACVAANLLTRMTDGGTSDYYALSITPRADNPFEKVDVKFAKRPEGCARQVFFESTVSK